MERGACGTTPVLAAAVQRAVSYLMFHMLPSIQRLSVLDAFLLSVPHPMLALYLLVSRYCVSTHN